MKMANIADFKNKLSYFLGLVEKGEEIEVCKRNIPIARVTPVAKPAVNQTTLGSGEGTVTFLSDDLTAPFLPEKSWDMLS